MPFPIKPPQEEVQSAASQPLGGLAKQPRQTSLTVVGLRSGLRYTEPMLALSGPSVQEAAVWLGDLLTKKTPEVVPAWRGPPGRPVTAHATSPGGNLCVVLEGVPGVTGDLRLGFAVFSPYGKPLWRVMTALPGALDLGPRPPTVPWCAWIGEVGGRGELPEEVKIFIRTCAAGWTVARQGNGHR